MDRELYEQIVAEYKKTGSVDLTAEACGTYQIKVRKVLITENLWHSRKSDAVNALRKRGYSVPEIAEELGMDEKNVQYYLPYTEKALLGMKTEGGKRVQSFRERSRNAAEGNVFKGERGVSTGESVPSVEESDEKERKTDVVLSQNPMGGRADSQILWMGYLLHAEMVCAKYDPEEDCEDIFEGERDTDYLRMLLKTKNGISRDVIVPGKMSLHQLSYMLQKAFGFQNCHLHHFSLPKKLFRQLTKENTGLWTELCGVYLHAPVSEDFEDLYWDDDYREGKSPNGWMKSKYTGDPKDYAVGETYIDTLRLMDHEREWVEMQMKERGEGKRTEYMNLPVDEHGREYYPEGNMNRVLERLAIQDLFDTKTLPESETEEWRADLRESIRVSRKYLQACRNLPSFQSLTEALDTLRFMRTERHNLDQRIWLKRNGIREELGSRPEELLEEIDREIEELEHHLGPAMHVFDPPAEPITDTLYFNYDYGDDWLIRVTCREIYTRREDMWVAAENPEAVFGSSEEEAVRDPEMEKKLGDVLLQRDFSGEYEYEDTDGRWVNADLRSALIRAELKKEPVCIAAEGLALVEDVGGIGGFFKFLQTIHGEDEEEAAGMRQWARSLGWKEVRPRPEGLL